eukprot:gene11049-18654_t
MQTTLPTVGVGLKPSICRPLCQRWHTACRNDFFGFDSRTGQLTPCSEAAADRLLVCSKLSTLAPTPEELCKVAGSSSSMRDLCESAPLASEEASGKKTKKPRKKRSSKRKLQSEDGDPPGLLERIQDVVEGNQHLVFLALLVLAYFTLPVRSLVAAVKSRSPFGRGRTTAPLKGQANSRGGGWGNFPGKGRTLGRD